ncbi:MAG TPA: hypothetical protein VK188_06945 [Holophaga sp.]|nr:hypothetical protein [Holophaga sp.]
MEADFGGLAGHSPGPRSQVNVERLALMASFRYHPRGGRPFVAVALGTSRFRSRLSEREPDTPPVADRWPIPFQEDGAPWIPRPGGSPRPTPASVPGADTGFRPTWGIGLGQCFGRHLEGEIRWVGLVHGGRTLGAWQVRVGIRF